MTAAMDLLRPADKECSQCGTWRPFADFHRNCQSPDGHHSVCKLCRHDQRKSYRSQRTNPAQAVLPINARRHWRTDEERLVLRWYGQKGDVWCAVRVGRTPAAVRLHVVVMRRREACS